MSPKAKPRKPIVAYVRVSEVGSRDEEILRSPEMQEAKVKQYGELHGLEIVTGSQFHDIDRSGGKMNRPGLRLAVEGIKAGKYGGLAVAKLNRFARTVSGAIRTIREIENAGGAFISIDPPVDTSTATGRAMLTILLAFYAMEREQTAEGTEQIHDDKIASGIYISGHAPAGYSYEVVGTDKRGKPIRGKLIPNEHATAIREAFDLKASGGTAGQVAALLTERGVPTSSGRTTWSRTAARTLIANEVYTGCVSNGGVRKTDEETGEEYVTKERRMPDAHEAIVPAYLWRKANVKTERTSTRGDGHVLGEGLCRCATCGGGLVKSSSGKYIILRCPKPRHVCPAGASIMYGNAEEYIVSAVLEKAGTLYLERRETSGEEFDAVERRLTDIDLDLSEYARQFEAGEIEADTFSIVDTKLRRQRRAVEEELSALAETSGITIHSYVPTEAEVGEAVPGVYDTTRSVFYRMPVSIQRRALRTLIERVTVTPGRASISERVSIEFKDGSTYAQESDAFVLEDGTVRLKPMSVQKKRAKKHAK